MRPTRRRLLQGLGGAGVLAASGLTVPFLLGSQGQTGRLLRSRLRLPRRFQVPLPIPRTLRPVNDGTDRYDVVQREARVEILPGIRTPIWGYEGGFPGPTIESRSGRTTIVQHHNELDVPVVVHLHGGRTPAASDGYPTDLIEPGKTRRYVFPLDQRAATLWYHDHRMDFTGPAVYRGLVGLHIVRDDEEDALPLPRGDHEVPLMLTDRAFDEDGSFLYPAVDAGHAERPGVREAYAGGVFGDVVLVNGAPWPVHEVDGSLYRLRILNASNARRYELALDPQAPDSPSFVQIGSDGGLLERPRGHRSITIAPAERFDVVVDFGRFPVGTEIRLVDRLDRDSAVMMFRVVRRGRRDARIPPRLSRVERLDRAAARTVREFSLRSGYTHHGRGWVIGGEAFSAGRIAAAPRLGATEIWRFVSDLHHPVHLHLAHFQVLSRGTAGPAATDGGWKDTVDLTPGQAVEVIARFDGYRGKYVFHCHNLEHEDMGMMANFTVT